MDSYLKNYFCLLILLLGVTACGPKPENITTVPEQAPIYPDYVDVVIPYNIAPMNFLVEGAEGLRVSIHGSHGSLTVTGSDKACFPMKKWKDLLLSEKGHTLQIEVTVRIAGKWLKYPPFAWTVASEPIDGYLSYRLIEPGYEVWNAIQLCERNIENFKEKVIADNNLAGGNCMNCHIYGKQSGSLSMFHLRGKEGGTILNRDGKLRKLGLKTDSMLSGAAYGDFHPSGRYAVFSSNIIIPAFHAEGNKRLEVYDTKSDLAIADFDQNRMIFSPLTNKTKELETFPSFSADGKWVYFCSAPVAALPDSVQQQRYSLCRIAFDPENGRWGTQVDTLWNASSHNGSVCFPKASPDGKYLLFTTAHYGTFPIWHRETDLRLMNMETGQTNTLPAVNSDRSDTYHSWASNSRWFVFASKRGDGQYGKPYFAYIDKNGKGHKPFVLPQEDPEHYFQTFKSYNIPELSETALPFDAVDIKKVYQQVQAEQFK